MSIDEIETMDRWMRDAYGTLSRLANDREPQFANEGSPTARKERLGADVLEQAKARLTLARGPVSSVRKRRYVETVLELATSVAEMGPSPGLVEEAKQIFDQANTMLDEDNAVIKAELDEQATRWLMMLQGTATDRRRVITKQSGQPISGEGGGVLTPESA